MFAFLAEDKYRVRYEVDPDTELADGSLFSICICICLSVCLSLRQWNTTP